MWIGVDNLKKAGTLPAKFVILNKQTRIWKYRHPLPY